MLMKNIKVKWVNSLIGCSFVMSLSFMVSVIFIFYQKHNEKNEYTWRWEKLYNLQVLAVWCDKLSFFQDLIHWSIDGPSLIFWFDHSSTQEDVTLEQAMDVRQSFIYSKDCVSVRHFASERGLQHQWKFEDIWSNVTYQMSILKWCGFWMVFI